MRKKLLSTAQKNRAIKMVQKGKSYDYVANKFNVSHTAVRNWVKAGVKTSTPVPVTIPQAESYHFEVTKQEKIDFESEVEILKMENQRLVLKNQRLIESLANLYVANDNLNIVTP